MVKVGSIKCYYDKLLILKLASPLSIYAKKDYSYLVSYPIVDKKLKTMILRAFFLHGRGLKLVTNLNQSVLIESAASDAKLYFNIPLLSYSIKLSEI
jgi:hypothetical protein